MPEEKRDWNKIVSESNGGRALVPDACIEEVKNWDAKRTELKNKVQEISALESEVSHLFENLIYKLRQSLVEVRPDIWLKDVGIDVDALKEGAYVINIVDDKR